MNGALLRRQVRGNLCGLRMAAVVVLSLGLIVVQYWTVHHAGHLRYASAPTFLREVMLFNADGNGSGLYLFILPFLAALLGGSVYADERLSGRVRALLPREGRSTVLRTSMLSGFLLGGIGGMLPLLLNLAGAAAVIPHLSFIDGDIVDKATGFVPQQYVLIDCTSWAYPLYRISQPLLIAVMLLLVFVISGLFATIAVGASFFTRHRHVELLVPFVLSVLWWMLPTLTFNMVPYDWSHNIFLYIAPGNGTPEIVAQQTYIGISLTIGGSMLLTGVSWLMEQHRDVL